jgi:hypothetical protein
MRRLIMHRETARAPRRRVARLTPCRYRRGCPEPDRCLQTAGGCEQTRRSPRRRARAQWARQAGLQQRRAACDEHYVAHSPADAGSGRPV